MGNIFLRKCSYLLDGADYAAISLLVFKWQHCQKISLYYVVNFNNFVKKRGRNVGYQCKLN